MEVQFKEQLDEQKEHQPQASRQYAPSDKR